MPSLASLSSALTDDPLLFLPSFNLLVGVVVIDGGLHCLLRECRRFLLLSLSESTGSNSSGGRFVCLVERPMDTELRQERIHSVVGGVVLPHFRLSIDRPQRIVVHLRFIVRCGRQKWGVELARPSHSQR